MAGRPKRRARLEAEQRRAQNGRFSSASSFGESSNGSSNGHGSPRKTESDTIPDAVPSRARAPAGAHHARSSEPPPPSQPPRPRPLKSPLIGGQTRAVADDVQAQTMLRLAQLIKPGVEVRIERARPTWAAGWLEDYALDLDTGDTLQDLYSHLAEEHGGQLYKLTVLAPGETPVYVGAVAIAGPVRAQGRPITRDAWDPAPRERQAAPAPAPAPAPLPFGELLTAFGGFMNLIMGQQEKAAAAQTEAVREMVRSSQQQTADFTAALLQVRSDESHQRGLAGQISELMDGVNAVEGLRKRFGAASGKGGDDDETVLDGALKQATTHFLGSVMGSMAGARRAAAPPRRPMRPPVRTPPNQVVGEQPQGIPDAIPGQAAAQN